MLSLHMRIVQSKSSGRMWNNAVLRICLLHFAEQKEERQPMETTTVDKDQIENTTAEHIRSLLHNAGIFTISVVGGPGSGKTALIDATIRALARGSSVERICERTGLSGNPI